MTRFRRLTPDARYVEDGVIERQAAGSDVDWHIRRLRSLGGRIATRRDKLAAQVAAAIMLATVVIK